MYSIGPVGLGALTVGAWAFLGLAQAVHRWLDRRQVIRAAEQVARDAAEQGRP